MVPTTTSSSSTTTSSTSTPSTSTPSTSSSTTIPHWRVLTASADGTFPSAPALFLHTHRPLWSPTAQQAAWQLYQDLQEDNCQDSYVAGPIQAALNVLDHAYRLYGPESVICSFNGGKDAVVILHLLRAVHAKYYHDHQVNNNDNNDDNNNNDDTTTTTTTTERRPVRMIRPRAIYFEQQDEFPQVTAFLQETVQQYDLDMIAFAQGVKFPQGLQVLVSNNYIVPPATTAAATTDDSVSVSRTPPYPLAFVLGTRTSDPNAGKQGHFAPSSHYMPPFMRVNPILDWTYGHVWHFLRLFQLPYCSLYDQGYTSLGTTKDTLPCPALAVAGNHPRNDGTTGASTSSHLPRYWPAYMLRDWEQERAGRIRKPTSGRNAATAGDNSGEEHSTTQTKPLPPTTDPDDSHNNASFSRTSSSVGNLSMLSDLRANPVVSLTPHQQQQARRSLPNKNDYNNNNASCVSFSSDTVTQRSVGVLIIGDEILKGFTADMNTHVAAKALFGQNVQLKRVVVVSDDLDEISREIQRLDDQVDVIITSGGVGPTHDDVTIKGVAQALDCDMVLHKEMAQLLRDKMNQKGDNTTQNNKEQELTEAQKKMAMLPSTSKLRYLSDDPNDWPVLQCQNIFILPGVPQFFAQKIENVAKYLSCQLERSTAYKVVLQVDENSIVPILNQVVANHPNVSIGSYPFVSHPEFKTVITLEGRLVTGDRNSCIFDPNMIEQSKETMDQYVELALDELLTTLPKGSVLRVDNDDMMLFE